MTEVSNTAHAERKGYSVASLVLGILAIVTSIVWYLGIILGILAIIFGAVSLGTRGRKKAIAGIVTGSIGIILALLFVLILYMAVPALQKNQRDTTRKNDVTVLSSDVMTYQTEHQGALPSATDLSTSNLAQVTAITAEGTPTTKVAAYRVGADCDGTASDRAYSIIVVLENGSHYCQGS